MSESLLSLPLKKGNYQEALEATDFFRGDSADSTDSFNACQLTQKTKAVLLDKGAEAGFAYFKEEFEKQNEKAQRKQAFLVSLYNQIMPDENSEELTYETFKERYLKSTQLASRFAREAFVVNQMEKVIANKDFDEVENAFALYTIMREERQLVNTKYMLDEQNEGLFAIENLNLT